MPDDVDSELATTQSTGDICSMTQVFTRNQNSPLPAAGLICPRKASSVAESYRAAPSLKSPTGGAGSKSTGTAVGKPETTTAKRALAPVLVDLWNSIGDHDVPRRGLASLPASPRDDEKTQELGRRPSPEPRDDATTTTTDLPGDVDDLNWATPPTHRSLPASTATSPTRDDVTDPQGFTTPAGNAVERVEYRLRRPIAEMTSPSSSGPDSVYRHHQASTAGAAELTSDAEDTRLKVSFSVCCVRDNIIR